jgi:hypothetical protein
MADLVVFVLPHCATQVPPGPGPPVHPRQPVAISTKHQTDFPPLSCSVLRPRASPLFRPQPSGAPAGLTPVGLLVLGRGPGYLRATWEGRGFGAPSPVPCGMPWRMWCVVRGEWRGRCDERRAARTADQLANHGPRASRAGPKDHTQKASTNHKQGVADGYFFQLGAFVGYFFLLVLRAPRASRAHSSS